MLETKVYIYMSKLIIVESPAKCKKIEGFLGVGYKCIATFGHITKLNSLSDIDARYYPTFSTIDAKKSNIKKLKYAIANATDIYIATDDDREGEAIGWHVCQLFKLPNTTKRIVFREITKSAVLYAVENPTILNTGVVNAAVGRQILDMLVGFIISPYLWKHVSYKNHLSAGRCQTPALRLIYDNEREIEQNPGVVVYRVDGYFTNRSVPFSLNRSVKQKMIDSFLEESVSHSHQLKKLKERNSVRPAPKPFTTSRIQQASNTKLGISPKDTMKICQTLYEEGYITYMRTDSQTYSTDFIREAHQYIEDKWGANYAKALVISKQPNAQEAHEAIRPTDINTRITPLVGREKRIYDMIWLNACGSLMADAIFQVLEVVISAPGGYNYRHMEEREIFLGWKILEYKESEGNLYNYFKQLKEGKVEYHKIRAKFVIEERRLHLTEAGLVKELERRGIGRPSTYSAIVDKIQKRKYVCKEVIKGMKVKMFDYEVVGEEIIEEEIERELGEEKGKLVIKPMGKMVMEFLLEYYEVLFCYDYTKQLEDELDKISNGELSYNDLCKGVHDNIEKLSQKLKNKKIEYRVDADHVFMIGKYGPTVKYEKDGKVVFKKVKKDIDYEKIKEGKYKVEEVIDDGKEKHIGFHEEKPVYIKSGPYGRYVQWNGKNKTIEEKAVLTLSEAVKLFTPIVALNKTMSIREGKYGKYIYYKTSKMKKPKFYNLDVSLDKETDKKKILDWIYLNHNI
jgi:DNA topoisomerase-1